MTFLTTLLAVGMISNSANIPNNNLTLNDLDDERIIEISSSSTNYKDEYENNNSYDLATPLTTLETHSLSNYQKSINATLDTVSQMVDVDYYYFNLLTDCNVSINIKTESNFSFNFSIMNYEYYIEDNVTKRQLHQMFYYDTTEKEKKYNGKLSAGTYFIYLRGQQAYNSNTMVEYNLDLSINACDISNNILAKSIVESDYLATIWLSDCAPTKSIPLFNITDEQVYYKLNEEGLHTPEYMLDDLKNLSNGLPIHLASYYISNPLVKFALWNFVNSLHDAYTKNLIEKEQKIKKLELVHDTISNTIKIACTIASNITVLVDAGINVTIIKFISLATLNTLFNLITPKFTIDDVFIIDYLSFYKGALDDGIDKSNVNYEELYNDKSQENRIIEIPVYFTFKSNLTNTTKSISFLDTTRIVNKRTDLITKCNATNKIFKSKPVEIKKNENEEDEIYAFSLRGKFYGIKNFDDYIATNSLSKFESNHTHKFNNHYCTECDSYLAEHSYTESYTWKSLTQHNSFCSCGAKTLENHVISQKDANSTSKYATCLLCGGRAEKGFIHIEKKNDLLLSNYIKNSEL